MEYDSDSISDNEIPSDHTHCDVESVDQVVDDENVIKDEGSKFKQGLRQFLWKAEGDHLTAWFNIPSTGPATSCLEKLEISSEVDNAFSLQNAYAVTVKNIKKPFQVCLNEHAVYKSLFTGKILYEVIGFEVCMRLPGYWSR